MIHDRFDRTRGSWGSQCYAPRKLLPLRKESVSIRKQHWALCSCHPYYCARVAQREHHRGSSTGANTQHMCHDYVRFSLNLTSSSRTRSSASTSALWVSSPDAAVASVSSSSARRAACIQQLAEKAQPFAVDIFLFQRPRVSDWTAAFRFFNTKDRPLGGCFVHISFSYDSRWGYQISSYRCLHWIESGVANMV